MKKKTLFIGILCSLVLGMISNYVFNSGSITEATGSKAEKGGYVIHTKPVGLNHVRKSTF